MADNRLLLRCRVCGAELPIARVSAGADDWTPARVPHDEYAAFLAAHGRCGPGLDMALAAEDRIGLSPSTTVQVH